MVFDAMLNLNRDDLRLYIAGSGSFEKKTKDKLDILIKNGLVVNLGFVENMDEIYPKFDYILGFSENEGLPRVVIEALSYGLGVIFSNTNVINEIYNISSKKDDFYIVNRTANDLRNLLLKIEKPKNKEADFNIINTFSFENFSKSILNFYSNYR
ncbi:glycosyltransferase [Campylobacter ureolyticus]|uniref:glycosyltransferase n=1 Tax=Campylobacter ureolyticus TaxID=827 RepID=UPI0026EDE2C9|nr:glycosyltransferase [Campylobacter ureolyticus]